MEWNRRRPARANAHARVSMEMGCERMKFALKHAEDEIYGNGGGDVGEGVRMPSRRRGRDK